MKNLFLLFLFCAAINLRAQNIPVFGNEINVTINGLSFDAMEPAVSADGSLMFFNSLNDGNTTSLYYATRINDSTYNFAGPVSSANQTITPRLDAVASIDTGNRFFWISTRNYPADFDNVFHGSFNGTDVVNTGRLHGNFYIYTPGWLVMDAAVDLSGNMLYYCNARFGNCGIPCEARLGIAQRINDSTFSKLSNSDALLDSLNDSLYITYAPFLSSDGLELYFTRILISNPLQSDICVAVRPATNVPFGNPSVLVSGTTLPEAAALTADKQRFYYHRKPGSLYEIKLRYRTNPASVAESEHKVYVKLFPNPASASFRLMTNLPVEHATITIRNISGAVVESMNYREEIDLKKLPAGIYLVQFQSGTSLQSVRLVKE